MKMDATELGRYSELRKNKEGAIVTGKQVS